jgi:hypothetical protein
MCFEEEVWSPPRPSRAKWLLYPVRTGSERSTVAFSRGNQVLVAEHPLEGQILQLWMANRDVVEIVDHPDPIEFTTEDGATHRFWFNYVIVMRDGRRIAVAVRYGEEAIYARATLPLVEPFMSNDFADTAMVMSEEDVDPVALFNAGWMLDCSRSRDNHINQEHDRIALAAVERLSRSQDKA